MVKVFDLVAGAIGELNAELDYDSFRNPTLETPIYSTDSDLDSLSLVLLVSAIEAAVNDQFGSNVLLASEKAMSMRHSPYRTVGSLVEFIEEELAAA